MHKTDSTVITQFCDKVLFSPDRQIKDNQIAWQLSKIGAQMARGRVKLPTAFHHAWCLLHAFKGEPNQKLNK